MLDGIFESPLSIEQLFDLEFYRSQRLSDEADPVRFSSVQQGINHFDEIGWRLGYSPARLFDTGFYLRANPDVESAGLNPLSHYINFGQYDGRRACPSSDRTAILSERGRKLWSRAQILADKSTYTGGNAPDALSDIDPFMHYASFGHLMGRNPISGFDPNFYRNTNEDIRAHNIDPVLHYLEFGHLERRHSGLGAQRLLELDAYHLEMIELMRESFDEKFYLEQTPFLKDTTVDPVAHYYHFGWQSEKDPNPDFSTQRYLETHDSLREDGINPFSHFLSQNPNDSVAELTTVKDFAVPNTSIDDFADINLSNGYRTELEAVPYVQVILPVYRGTSETLACLKALLTAKNKTTFKVLVLDDCSPEPDLSEILSSLSEQFGFAYERNLKNMGFVKNVNRGFELSQNKGDAHVFILNSDAILYDEWLDLLKTHLDADPSIATVTPLSNNATIMSYPQFCQDNNKELELTHREIADLAKSSSVSVIDVPTGVGFAMLISQQALQAVGRFNTTAFGRGYGEEVDFCQRASILGFKNVAAPNVFVSHLGSVSFADVQKEANIRAQEVLEQLHPGYGVRVQDFINGDPLKTARAHLDLQRLVKSLESETFIITFSHGLGGGTKRYVSDVADLAKRAQTSTVQINVVSEVSCAVRYVGADSSLQLPNLKSIHFSDLLQFLDKILTLSGFRTFMLNSLLGMNSRFRKQLLERLERHPDRTSLILHDYSIDCPRSNFVNSANVYCGGKQPVETCKNCIADFRQSWDIDIASWRRIHEDFAGAASRIIVPNSTVLEHIDFQATNNAKVVVRPHDESVLDAVAPLSLDDIDFGSELRDLVVVGAIGPHKGSRVLRTLKELILKRSLPLRIHLVGYSDLADLGDGKTLIVHGKYTNEVHACRLIRSIKPHGGLSLSVWPETYCYTLSLLIRCGLPVIGFDIGAQGQRLHEYTRGTAVDPSLSLDITSLAKTISQHDWQKHWATTIEQKYLKTYKDLDNYLS